MPDRTNPVVERFAPSPTGLLHLGHAFSALTAHDAASTAQGRFLLRIEDLDRGRSRAEYAAAIAEDLAWLGLSWEEPICRQSMRAARYRAALDRLAMDGLVFRCVCTRSDLAAAGAAPQEGAADGPRYPGTCRGTPPDDTAPAAMRLDMTRAIGHLGGAAAVARLVYTEIGEAVPNGQRRVDPEALLEATGDPVLFRKDGGAAYHLAVVVDDADQGISHVTRGADLAVATPLHRLLQALLGLPTPVYRHHRLVRDGAGRRLAKRDDARAIRTYRADGASPEEIRRMVGLPPATPV